MSDNIMPRVNVTIEVEDAITGVLLQRQEVHNLVVTAGRNMLRDFLNGDVVTGLTHFALGTGTTAVIATDTTLGTEVFRDAFTSTAEDTAKLTIRYYLASGDANGNTLAEAGLFTDPAAGTMYARAILASTIAKTASLAVTFTWELTFSA